jgi:Sulfotransferase family
MEAAPMTAEQAPARRSEVPAVTFVGGTGRSGTHVVARLMGSHRKLKSIPVECRFHTDDRGFPGLLEGRVTKRAFVRRMRGFWWRGFQTSRMRGLYRFVPRERFERALSVFEEGFDAEPEPACRRLFMDLLLPAAHEAEAIGILEQSCETISRAPMLLRLFPDAGFVHVVRDGRDASASRVSQTRGLIYPRTRAQGLEWWERRLREMDSGASAVPTAQLREISLDELLLDWGPDDLRHLLGVAGLGAGRQVRRFFRNRMSTEQANSQRWLEGLSERRRERVDRLYAEALDRLEADGVSSAPLLRRTWKRRIQERT